MNYPVLELTEDQKKLLRSPLPKEAVKQHPTKTYLSSIKAVYVTERMNQVFGIGKWTTKVSHEVTTAEGMVVVKLTFEVPEYGIYYECYGGNDNGGGNSKNFDLGDAYKGATTDAITKVGSYLEIGIDVFKGLNDSKPQVKPEKQWLNPGTEQWQKVVVALKGEFTMPQVKAKYNISKPNETKLMEEAAS